MGLALLLVVWLITFVSTFFFIKHPWWLPQSATTYGPSIDAQFTFTFLTMGIVFVAAQVALGLFVWKYRDRAHSTVYYSHGNLRLEAAWTVLTAVLFIGLNLMGEKIWAEARFQGPAPGALPVEVTGMQFQWYFRYPGPDGTFGHSKPELEDPSTGNALGIDPDDPTAKDDIVTSTLVLPVNKQTDITLRAIDVIHDFFVPEFRFKQDAVPGLLIHMHFTPDRIGDYEIDCAELCGSGHYKMRAGVRVVSQPDFDAFMKAPAQWLQTNPWQAPQVTAQHAHNAPQDAPQLRPENR